MAKESHDVVVVGAGIVGAACADALAARGLRVAVVDRDGVGGGATAAGMGHIVVMDDSDAQFALTNYSQRLWHELRPELPDDVEFQQSGTIWVAADEEEMAEVLRKRDYYQKRGVAVEVLDSCQLKEAETNLRDGLAGGLLVPRDAVLYPPCAARFLMTRAQQRVAKLRLDASVTQTSEEEFDSVTVRDYGWDRGECCRIERCRPDSRHCNQETQRPPCITDRYPEFLHQLVELGYRRRAFGESRFGGFQCAAAPDRTDSDRILAAIRRRTQRSGSSYSGKYDPAGTGIHARARVHVSGACMDRLSRCDP